MFYLLKVYVLVAMVVLVPTAFIVMTLMAFHEVKEYARARRVMRQVAAGRRPEFNGAGKLAYGAK